MTGWVIFVVLAGLLFVIVWRLGRLSHDTLQLLGAALCIAAAGYAWQGMPDMPGKPTPPRAEQPQGDSLFALERPHLFDRFGRDAQILDSADAMHRAGLDAYGIALIRGGLAKHPDSPALWTGMGFALTLYADGAVTPAADLAFDRAIKAAPDHPGSLYFRGLAYAQSGQIDTAEKIWLDLLNRAPEAAPWRNELIRKLIIIRLLREQQKR